MNSDVAHSFKELLMGHSVKLDDVYYDKDNQLSRQKIVVEYMKAVDALTINEEYRLKKKIDELTIKTKDSDYIIKAKLQEKDEQVKTVTEQLNTMQSQMQVLILTLGNMDEINKNTFAKQLFSEWNIQDRLAFWVYVLEEYALILKYSVFFCILH